MMKKKLYNVICFENETIQNTNDEWIRIRPVCRRGTFTEDKIFFYVKVIPNKSKILTLYIGNEICKLLNFNKGDILAIDSSRKNPFIIKISKSNDGEGYTLHRSADQNTTLRLSLTLKKELESLKVDRSKEIDFDFLNDNSIVINFSEHRE